MTERIRLTDKENQTNLTDLELDKDSERKTTADKRDNGRKTRADRSVVRQYSKRKKNGADL